MTVRELVASMWLGAVAVVIVATVLVSSADAGQSQPEGETIQPGWTFGTPQLPGAYNNNCQILQTPDHVVIVSEMIHDTRIVQLDDRPVLAATVAQWHGDARAEERVVAGTGR